MTHFLKSICRMHLEMPALRIILRPVIKDLGLAQFLYHNINRICLAFVIVMSNSFHLKLL